MNILFLLIGLFANFTGLYAIYQAWRQFRFLFYLRTSINTLNLGQRVKITGRLSAKNRQYRSRISQTPCIFWQVQVLTSSASRTGPVQTPIATYLIISLEIICRSN